eukprot:5874842-Amphidinium_carterae.4
MPTPGHNMRCLATTACVSQEGQIGININHVDGQVQLLGNKHRIQSVPPAGSRARCGMNQR